MKTSLQSICIITCMFISSQLLAQWQPSDTGNNIGGTFCLLESSGKLFVGTGYGTYASTNNGFTWTQSNSGMTLAPYCYVFCLGKNSVGIFAGSENKIYFSNDNGISWNVINNLGYQSKGIAFLGDTVFVATTGGGVLMSPNNGTTWIPLNNGLTTDTVYSIVTKGHQLFAGTKNNGVFVSSNSGSNWSSVSNGIPTQATINCLETDGTNLFAGTISDTLFHNNGIYKSINNGTSWLQVSGGFPIDAQIYDIFSIGNALLATNGLVYRSLDHGTTWMPFNENIVFNSCGGIDMVRCFCDNTAYMFCGVSYDCYISIYRRDINEVVSTNEYPYFTQNIILFPNPTSNLLHLQLPDSFGEVKTLSIYNSLGQLQIIQGNIPMLNFSGYETGLYYLIATNSKGATTHGKVLKE